jgi:hypothetical protein
VRFWVLRLSEELCMSSCAAQPNPMAGKNQPLRKKRNVNHGSYIREEF